MQKFCKVAASGKASIFVTSIAFLHASFSDHLHLIARLELGTDRVATFSLASTTSPVASHSAGERRRMGAILL
jgi:hypothetical protein